MRPRQEPRRVGNFRPKHLRCTLAALASDTSGNTAILAALMLPVVVGGMGLGTETGYWYWTQRKLQHAADVSAHAAGIRKKADPDNTAAIEAAALNIATKAGYEGGADNIDVDPNYDFSEPDDAVEVVLTESKPRLFSSIFSSEPVTISARAVSQANSEGGGVACLLALAPTGTGITFLGNPSVTLDKCNIAANSSASNAFSIGGSATASAECVYTVGGGSVQKPNALTTDSDKCSEKVKEDSPVVPDPYANVPEPTPTGACKAWTTTDVTTGSGKNKVTYKKGVPGYYCDINFKGDVRLDPGLYHVKNSLGESGNTTVTGSNVTFFLAKGASVQINGNAVYNLSAPTKDYYEANPNKGFVKGVLFFGSRGTPSVSHKVNGGSNSTFQGAIYFPASAVEYTGNSSTTNGCTQLIGYTISFKGNSGLKAECHAAGFGKDAGTTDINVGGDQKIAIVE